MGMRIAAQNFGAWRSVIAFTLFRLYSQVSFSLGFCLLLQWRGHLLYVASRLSAGCLLVLTNWK